MLNQRLYNSLVRAFGRVRIGNEGDPISYRVETNLHHTPACVGDRKYLKVISRGEAYRVCCPFCGDTRFRLWINHRWNTTDPVTGLSFGLGLMTCFNDGCPANRDAPVPRRRMCQRRLADLLKPYLARVLGFRAPAVPAAKALRPVSLPGQCVSLARLSSMHPAITYLRSRGFDPVRLEQEYRLSFCAAARNKSVEGRIIVPFYKDGRLIGWQARYVGEPKTPNVGKYYTMPGLPKNRLLYNYDNARRTRFGVIVEGVTDVWRTGRQAVALLGCSMSASQAYLAVAAWGETGVGLMLDPEFAAAERSHPGRPTAYERIVERLSLAKPFKWGLLQVRLPFGKDPGQMSTDEIWDTICAQARAAGYEHPVREEVVPCVCE